MKTNLLSLLLLLSIASFSQAFDFNYHKDFEKILAQTNDPKSKLHYDKLLKRFKTNDTTLTDFETLALLIGFTDNKYFKPYEYLQTERDIYVLNDEGKFNQALKAADSLLTFVPVSQNTIIEKSYAHHKLNQEDSSTYYMWQFRKIMDAMARSGKVGSIDSAFFSLGPTDGQHFITKYLRGNIGTMGSGSDKYGNFIDILGYRSDKKDAKEIPIYFQIEHAIKTMGIREYFEEEKKKKDKK